MKKIALSAVAFIAAGGFFFLRDPAPGENTCPDRPGCICPKGAKAEKESGSALTVETDSLDAPVYQN